MTIVAIVALAVAGLAVAVCGRLVRSLVREHHRERQQLLDQIMHLAGRTWTPPPSDRWSPARDGEPLVHEFTATPEQSLFV